MYYTKQDLITTFLDYLLKIWTGVFDYYSRIEFDGQFSKDVDHLHGHDSNGCSDERLILRVSLIIVD